jgi:hypothetical protein
MNAKVFINYRREDTAPYAGRLYDRLTAHFGEGQVFMDIAQIEPGEDFVEVIDRKVSACDIAIVAIGPNWLRTTDASGKRRVDDEEDFVRMEIVAALQRKIRVIPVLLGGARMPGRHDLPEALAPLSRRNAIEVSETRFHADVNRLIEAIEKSFAVPEEKAESFTTPVKSTQATPSTPPVPSTSSIAALKERKVWTSQHRILVGVIALSLLTLAGFFIWPRHQKAAEQTNQPAIANLNTPSKPAEPKLTDQGNAATRHEARAEVKQRIALTDITVKYDRPLVNGRKIWGEVVPYGKVWRAGANENATVEFSDPVSVEGQPLPKGTYGLHMIPNPDSWTVIFSKTNMGSGSYSYKQDEDALRVNVKPKTLPEQKEALEFEFEDLKPTSTAATMKWEKLGVPFAVSVNDADQTLQNIRAQLKGRGQFTWRALDEGAQFCLTRKINLDEALRWADASIQNEERFENLSTKADILKALNRQDEAKTTWNKALEKAKASDLYTYGRQLQNQRKGAEAMEIFKEVAKRFPQGIYGNLAQARLKSAAGDFASAANDAKQAQAAAPTDTQKQAIQALITRLDAKQDINK